MPLEQLKARFEELKKIHEASVKQVWQLEGALAALAKIIADSETPTDIEPPL